MTKAEEIKNYIANNKGNILDAMYAVKEHISGLFINESKVSFCEYYLYRALSNGISFLQNQKLNAEISTTQIYSLRLVFESLLIISNYDDDNDELYELIMAYNFYLFYEHYKNDEDFYEKARNDSTAKKEYIDLIINDSSSFLNIVKDKIPFVLEDYSFKPLINGNLDCMTVYYLFHYMTEPASYDMKNTLLGDLNKVLLEKSINYTLIMLNNKILDYSENNDVHIILGYHNKVTNKLNNPYYKKFIECLKDESKAISKIANSIQNTSCLKEFREILKEISRMIIDINYDILNGLFDIAIEKIKIFFESLALGYKYIENKIDHNDIMSIIFKAYRYSGIRYRKICIDGSNNKNVKYKEELKKYLKDYNENINEVNLDNPIDFINHKIKISEIVNDFINAIGDPTIIEFTNNLFVELKNIVYCGANIEPSYRKHNDNITFFIGTFVRFYVALHRSITYQEDYDENMILEYQKVRKAFDTFENQFKIIIKNKEKLINKLK